ncbi:MAG TPA: biopolymer transporter ExbD [Ignavibacteria bacterium]|nr:biopolymer transporter ExbD [Ignavibacteria bacterium]
MKFEISSEPITAFSYSSLTDIVMLLIIFFLLTSQFVVQTGVKVKLPGSKTNEQIVPSKLIVTLTQAGAVYLGSDQISLAELPGRLNALKSQTSEDNLIIRADKSVAIELVIKVIDAGKAAGIDKFTIQTQRENL